MTGWKLPLIEVNDDNFDTFKVSFLTIKGHYSISFIDFSIVGIDSDGGLITEHTILYNYRS